MGPMVREQLYPEAGGSCTLPWLGRQGLQSRPGLPASSLINIKADKTKKTGLQSGRGSPCLLGCSVRFLVSSAHVSC